MKTKDFAGFCEDSFQWCKQESEGATTSILDAIQNISDNAERVSSMSDDVLDALGKIKEKIENIEAENQSDRIEHLTNLLKNFSQNTKSIDDVINPIIRALQFQDRISQNMDNSCRILKAWAENKDKVSDITEFGKILLKNTTMAEERDIIRSIIPGLPEEEEKKGALLF